MAKPGMKSTADFVPGERKLKTIGTPELLIRAEIAGLTAGEPADASPRIEGGKTPFFYSLSGDSALSVSSSGVISGIPSGVPVTLTVRDSSGQQKQRTFLPELGVGANVNNTLGSSDLTPDRVAGAAFLFDAFDAKLSALEA